MMGQGLYLFLQELDACKVILFPALSWTKREERAAEQSNLSGRARVASCLNASIKEVPQDPKEVLMNDQPPPRLPIVKHSKHTTNGLKQLILKSLTWFAFFFFSCRQSSPKFCNYAATNAKIPFQLLTTAAGCCGGNCLEQVRMTDRNPSSCCVHLANTGLLRHKAEVGIFAHTSFLGDHNPIL